MPRGPFDSVRGVFRAAEVMLWESLVDTCFDGDCTQAGSLGTPYGQGVLGRLLGVPML